jgi:hypothetical protein
LKQILSRFPSRKDLASIFLVCVFPIHAWAFFVFLYEYPAYQMHLSASEIAGILAYVLLQALLESLLAAGVLTVLALVLPGKWFLDRFITLGVILVSVTALWFAGLNFWVANFLQNSLSSTAGDQLALLSLGLPVLLWLLTYAAAIVILSAAERRFSKFERALQDIADRSTILSAIFLTFDLLGLVIIGVRNFL